MPGFPTAPPGLFQDDGNTPAPHGYGIDWGNPLSDDIVAAYPIWEAAGSKVQDVVNGRDATLANSPTWVASEKGPALDFVRTSSQRVSTPLNLYDMGIRRHATIATLFNAGVLNNRRYIFGDFTASQGLAARINADETIDFFVYPGNHRIVTTATVTENQWSVLCAVLDGANMYLYLDGVQVGTQTLGEDIGDSGVTFKIGVRGDSTDSFEGQIALTLVSARAWSASEVVDFNVDPFAMLTLASRTQVGAAAAAASIAVLRRRMEAA